jgi:hypothetical protein
MELTSDDSTFEASFFMIDAFSDSVTISFSLAWN